MQNYNQKIKTPGSRFRGNDIYPVHLSRSTLGFTLWELVCVIAVIALFFALLMPSLNKVKRISTRVVCGTNLKGLTPGVAIYSFFS